MIRYSVEFESNDYENYLATCSLYTFKWKNQDAKLYVYNYNYYYDFSCIGIETMIALLERGHVIIKACLPSHVFFFCKVIKY